MGYNAFEIFHTAEFYWIGIAITHSSMKLLSVHNNRKVHIVPPI